jgi:hypothetical protein
MYLEFFAEGCEDCPLILIYSNDRLEVKELKHSLDKLAQKVFEQIPIHNLPFCKAVNDCQLDVKITQENSRMTQIGNSAFLWELTNEQCLEVIELLEPFELEDLSTQSKYQYQYLFQNHDVSIIFSTQRQW